MLRVIGPRLLLMTIYLARSRDIVDATHSHIAHVCFSDILDHIVRVGTLYPTVLPPVTFRVSTRRQYVHRPIVSQRI